MLNKEKYAKEIFEIACNGSAIAVVKGKLVTCVGTSCKDCDFYSKRGRDCIEQCKEWCEAECVEPQVDWSKVAVDTPILVRDNESEKWLKRYFAKFENGRVYTWVMGATYWSAGPDDTTNWKCAKLAEEEQGKPTWLPCKVDDVIYAIMYDCEKDRNVIRESRIVEVTQNINGWFFKSLITVPAFRPHDFGKTVFLSREEAEAKLKEMEDCHYCEYACCSDRESSVDCYVEDFAYFDHHVTDPKEAETCDWFRFCDIFPKF